MLLIVLLEAERFGGYTRKVLGSVLEYLMFKHGHHEPIWEIMVRTVGREPLWVVYVKFNQMWKFVLEVAAMARSAIAAMVRLDGRAETEVREGPEAVVHSGSGEFGVAYTIMTWTRDERRKARSMWNRIGEWTWSRRRRQSSWVVVGVE